MTTATEARELPILFKGPMVRAILEGTKTQTRRVVKPEVPEAAKEVFAWFPPNPPQPGERYAPGGLWARNPRGLLYLGRCPYGQPGDLLYVRESFAEVPTAGGGTDFVFAADYTDGSDREAGVRYKPSIFMPKALSRIWLRVTDVRVERVQEICEMECYAEGISDAIVTDPDEHNERVIEDFRRLWDSINAGRGHPWESNPWVWVVSFDRAESPA